MAKKYNREKKIKVANDFKIYSRGVKKGTGLTVKQYGIKTGIDLDKTIAIAKKVESLVGHKLPGQVMRAGHRLLSYSMDEVPTAVGA